MPKSARFYERGSGTLYFLFLAGAVGIALVGLQQKAAQDLSRARIEKMEVARASLHRRIKTLAASDEALRYSLLRGGASNNNFRTCINTTPVSAASRCGFSFLGPPPLATRKNQAEFHLFNPANDTQVTGRDYTDKGELCSANPGQPCVFRARSFFLRDCANASPCGTRYLTLVQIDYMPSPTQVIPRLASIPTDAAFASYLAFAREANLNSVVNPSGEQCPPGAMVDKVANGRILCKCMPGIARQTGNDPVTGHPICTLQKTCATTENFSGYDSNGVAICTQPTDSNCAWVDFSGGNLDCGYDGFGQRKAMKVLDILCCGMLPSGSRASGPKNVWTCFRSTRICNATSDISPIASDNARAQCCSLNP